MMLLLTFSLFTCCLIGVHSADTDLETVDGLSVKWLPAYRGCRETGGYLTRINNKLPAIKKLLSTENSEALYWIGASDIGWLGDWTYLDGTSLSKTPSSGDGYCGSLITQSSEVKNENCNYLRQYICEKPAKLCKKREGELKKEVICDKVGYVAARGVCLRISTTILTWSEAETSCSQDGGRLLDLSERKVKLMALRDSNSLIVKPSDSNVIYWTGASKPDGSNNWTWISGKEVDMTKGWNNYKAKKDQNCAGLRTASPSAMLFRGKSCNFKLRYICEMPGSKKRM